jgi:hypothetical protein
MCYETIISPRLCGFKIEITDNYWKSLLRNKGSIESNRVLLDHIRFGLWVDFEKAIQFSD